MLLYEFFAIVLSIYQNLKLPLKNCFPNFSDLSKNIPKQPLTGSGNYIFHMKSEHLFILDKHFGSKGVWFLDKFQSTCAIIACITIKVVSSNLVQWLHYKKKKLHERQNQLLG
jgi:hypothetical protein